MKRISLIGIVIIFFALSLNAQVIQTVSSGNDNLGNVNWSGQVIQATGIGAPNPNQPLAAQRANALRAATLSAARNLLEVVQGINLTSETTVENSMVTSDVIVTRVKGVLRNYRQVGEPRYMSTGDVEVTIEVPLTGELSDVLLPTGMGTYQPTPSTMTAQGAAFTGLIINAKGLGLRPAMAPKVLDENGNEIYGSKYVSREWAVKIGMVGYDKDINRARTNDRVTNNPLVINGLKVAGPNKADLVISNADAARIQTAAANMNFLDKCKVMFIVD